MTNAIMSGLNEFGGYRKAVEWFELDEIIGILTATITRLRRDPRPPRE